jgi:hypothetical protein
MQAKTKGVGLLCALLVLGGLFDCCQLVACSVYNSRCMLGFVVAPRRGLCMPVVRLSAVRVSMLARTLVARSCLLWACRYLPMRAAAAAKHRRSGRKASCLSAGAVCA